MRILRATAVSCVVMLLAACAAQPSRQNSRAVAIAAPHPPAPVTAALPPPPPPDVWSKMRASFALDDCNANPRVSTWARRYTGNPQHFEEQIRDALPLLMYVAGSAEHAGVPGEFVMLPWVESSYNAAEPGRGGDPAGMWQIMPQTARTLGLVMNRDYDGRLDPAAATPAVMAMLKTYGEELHDWRLVDMAFNAGEYKMLRVVAAHGGADKTMPLRLPISAVTRDHLTKLLALACIVRDPARFNVDLPKPSESDKLALVALPKPSSLASAARMADLPLSRVRVLNPGYRGDRMSADAPYHLLLPQSNAETLLAALKTDGADRLAEADNTELFPSVSHLVAESSGKHAMHRHHQHLVRHKVLRGESLRVIAKRYHIDTRSLRTWNGLASDALHPGQMLLLSAPD